jgi:hypothetical protein
MHLVKNLFPKKYSSFFVLDMRKALSRDVEKKFLIPIPHPVRPEDLVDD